MKYHNGHNYVIGSSFSTGKEILMIAGLAIQKSVLSLLIRENISLPLKFRHKKTGIPPAHAMHSLRRQPPNEDCYQLFSMFNGFLGSAMIGVLILSFSIFAVIFRLNITKPLKLN